MATQRKRTTTVHLTRRTFDALQQRARRAGKEADALADEMLAQVMEGNPLAPVESERDRIRRIMREEGVTVDTSQYRVDVDPNTDFEAIRKELASLHFDPPLSETIIEDRHRR